MTLPEGQAPQQSSSVETESMDNSACQQQQQQKPPRRRREMQAITKIVETRENPYVDGYFWKNNGNTVQKKTGNKSIYYKCSNSSKVCRTRVFFFFGHFCYLTLNAIAGLSCE